MNVITKKNLKPIAQRMARGIKPTNSEIRFLRVAAADVQEREFKALLQTAGNELTLRLCRQAGKELLNKIRFASGARRKNDLPPDNPRPEKIKRWLQQGKVLRRVVSIALCVGGIVSLSSCATTQYERVEVTKLTDLQLIEELASVEREVGIQSNRRDALLAIDTSPRPVVMSATTTYSGNFNAHYNNANRALYGSFNGSGYTTYQTADANGGARFAQALGLIITASNTHKLEDRRRAILAEISRRRGARETKEHITGQFLAAHPDIAANRDLLIACLFITQHRTADPFEQLQQAAEMMRELPEHRWVGWVEAHGIPDYPCGIVVGSYIMDIAWHGDSLTGKGQGSDGLEMTLTATKKQDGTITGIVRSEVMAAKFVGRITDFGLCVDYFGKNGGHPIKGITWAFRHASVGNVESAQTPLGQTQRSPYSGRYFGSGKDVKNGVELPYQITLDVSESGDVSFICTTFVKNHEAIVRGKGIVDSNGSFTLKTEFGDTEEGTILGNTLTGGHVYPERSMVSSFTATRQD